VGSQIAELICMNDTQHFAKLIKDIKFAMLNTLNARGQITSRPMTLQQIEFDGALWFFASKTSEFVKDIENNHEVNLTFSNPKDMSFTSANGEAVVINDENKKNELWKPMYQAWFPEGLNDPNLCLLKISIHSADYWEAPGLKIVRLMAFAKAAITGKSGDLAGKHGHLN
jgi:general stress protein 26